MSRGALLYGRCYDLIVCYVDLSTLVVHDILFYRGCAAVYFLLGSVAVFV